MLTDRVEATAPKKVTSAGIKDAKQATKQADASMESYDPLEEIMPEVLSEKNLALRNLMKKRHLRSNRRSADRTLGNGVVGNTKYMVKSSNMLTYKLEDRYDWKNTMNLIALCTVVKLLVAHPRLFTGLSIRYCSLYSLVMSFLWLSLDILFCLLFYPLDKLLKRMFKGTNRASYRTNAPNSITDLTKNARYRDGNETEGRIIIIEFLYIILTRIIIFYFIYTKIDDFFPRALCNFMAFSQGFKLNSYSVNQTHFLDQSILNEQSSLNEKAHLDGQVDTKNRIAMADRPEKDGIDQTPRNRYSNETHSAQNTNSNEIHFTKNRTNFADFYKFLMCPSLVFKNLKRTKPTNSLKIICLVATGVVYVFVFLSIFEHVALPTVASLQESSTDFADKKHWLNTKNNSVCFIKKLGNSVLQFLFKDLFSVKRIILFTELAPPVLILFILSFKINFEILTPLQNEMTGLEIELYKDWWNSKDSLEFWRKWNIPVHSFIKEHIYKTLLRRNFTKKTGVLICLLFSGFFHELIISLALRRISWSFFLAMILQGPLNVFTIACKRQVPAYGNFIFLLIFCGIGQPILFYSLAKQQN